MSDDIHEIYAIKYGRHERKKAENYIGGDPHDGQEPIDYFVWAIKGPSGSIVVDTGFDEAMARKRSRVISHPIAEGLKAIDVAPDSVAVSVSDTPPVTGIVTGAEACVTRVGVFGWMTSGSAAQPLETGPVLFASPE